MVKQAPAQAAQGSRHEDVTEWNCVRIDGQTSAGGHDSGRLLIRLHGGWLIPW